MEYLDGPPLTKWIEQNGPAPAQVIFEIMKDIADGVDAIHERCLLHRDIKPDNIIMVADLPTPSPKLIDFGLVRDSAIEGEHHTQADVGDARLRCSGTALEPRRSGPPSRPIPWADSIFLATGEPLIAAPLHKQLSRNSQ